MLRDYSRRRVLGVSVLLILLLITSVLMFREGSVRLPRYSACQQRLARLEYRVGRETAWKLEDRAEGDDSRSADSFLIQLEYARFRLDSLRKDKLPRLQKFQWTLGGLEKDYKDLRRGRDPYLNRKGILLRAYYSDIDGTLQPFSLAIPRDYTGKNPYPLIVHLHSHGWFRPFQGHPPPKVRGAIVLSPHGRGSTDYMFLGEQDVLHAIAVTKRLYNIDGDRVYLMGRSMGGTGCWQLAVHHPELFAAIAPTCGNTDHSVWEEKGTREKGLGQSQTPEKSMVPLKGLIQSALDPITYAANLKNVPVYCAHGARDTIVSVEHSRNMVRRLRQAGGEVKYAEFPEADHDDFPDWLFKDQVAWLLRHRRPKSPVAARITVGDLLPWQKGRKPGPVEDAFLSRFLVVYGTSSEDATENLVARREAEQLVHEWKRRYGHPCRCKSDKEVTEQDIVNSNLILYGGPRQNAISCLFEEQAPLRISDHGISWGGVPRGENVAPSRTEHRRYQGDDLGAKFCFPNPRNGERYIVVFAGTTWRGLFQINQRFGNWFDWGAYDNRNWFDYAVFDSRSIDPEGFLAVGFFNSNWQFDPATSWQGDPGVRERVVPRHTPIYFEPPTDRPSLRLSDLMPVFIDQQKGTVELDRSFRANPLRIGDRQFARGLGVRAPSRVVYDLGGGWSHFHATVGLDGEGEPVSPDRREAEWVEFRILGDGRVLAKSPEVSWESPSHTFDVTVKGVNRLELITKPTDWRLWLFGSAGWGDVEVTR